MSVYFRWRGSPSLRGRHPIRNTASTSNRMFGGGMIAAGDAFLERIHHHVRELAFPVPAAKTQIRYAQLGSDAGFIGAAACGRQLIRRAT